MQQSLKFFESIFKRIYHMNEKEEEKLMPMYQIPFSNKNSLNRYNRIK